MGNSYAHLKTAYDKFGKEGPKSLVASLKQTGLKNTDELINQLIGKHLINMEIFLMACEKELACFPDIFQLLEKFPETLRFTKQVYLNRKNPVFNDLFIKVTQLTPGKIMTSFIDYYRLNSKEDAGYLISICLESWFSKLDINHIDAEKMFHHFDKLIKTFLKFKEEVEFKNDEAMY